MTSIDRSAINAVDCDPSTGAIDVQFHSGRTSTHRAVPASVYLALIDAPSAGSYYSHNIRGRYP
jgi:hypothetical protein